MASLDYCPWVPTFVDDPVEFEKTMKAAAEEYAPPLLPARQPRPEEMDEETQEQIRQDLEMLSLRVGCSMSCDTDTS
jgi:hypothetical protein